MTHIARIIVLSFFLFIPLAHAQMYSGNGKIKIIITDLRNTDGELLISLFNSPEGFPSDNEAPLLSRNYKIKNNTLECEFERIPFGEYAIAILHDENGNGEMDANFILIPKEGVGVSNNAMRTFGPPKFEDSRFKLDKAEKIVNIKMHYY